MAVEPPATSLFDSGKPPDSSPPPVGPTPARTRRWLAVALFVSLGANLFLGGMLTVDLLRREAGHPRHSGMQGRELAPPHSATRSRPGPDLRRGPREGRRDGPGDEGRMLFHAAELLGDPKHPLVTQLKEQTGPQLRERRRAMRAARKEVGDALRAQPFDEAALEAALASLRAETDGSQELLHHTLVELAAHMDDQQRAELTRRARRFGKWGDDK